MQVIPSQLILTQGKSFTNQPIQRDTTSSQVQGRINAIWLGDRAPRLNDLRRS
jgi:hypothetical protein